MPIQKFKFLAITALIACFNGFAVNIYMPSIITMAEQLKTTIGHIQQTTTIFTFAVAVSHLFYGPLSEIKGRRVPLMIGLFISIVGSIVCCFAQNIETLMIGRFIQGLGIGAGTCLWRAIMKDSLQGNDLSKYSGYLSILFVTIVAAAPLIGGYMEEYLNWHYSLLIILIYSLIASYLVVFKLPETNIHHHKDRASLNFFKEAFASLLTSRIFMGYSLCVFLTYGAIFSWFMVSPVIYIAQMGVSPEQYGLINFLPTVIAISTGGFVNGKICPLIGSNNMLRLGWCLMFVISIIIIIIDIFIGHNLISIIGLTGMLQFSTTLIWPNCFMQAFAPFNKIAGYASTLYSAIQMCGGAIIGSIITLIPNNNPTSIAIIFMLCSVFAYSVLELWINKSKLEDDIN